MLGAIIMIVVVIQQRQFVVQIVKFGLLIAARIALISRRRPRAGFLGGGFLLACGFAFAGLFAGAAATSPAAAFFRRSVFVAIFVSGDGRFIDLREGFLDERSLVFRIGRKVQFLFARQAITFVVRRPGVNPVTFAPLRRRRRRPLRSFSSPDSSSPRGRAGA